MATICLVCYCAIHKYDSKNLKVEISTSNNFTSQTSSVLSNHLDVIFILRNIFELPVSQLSNYLKNCPNVDNWICICDKCEDIISGYRRIYEDLLEISRKFQETKLGIIKIVKTSYNDNGKGSDLVPDITDECRRFINYNEYQNPCNPFKDGDLRALELIKSIHPSNWHWNNGHDDAIGPGSPADINDEYNDHDYWSGNDDDDANLDEPEPEEQLQNRKRTTKDGSHPTKKQMCLRELMDEWKPGYKPKKKKWKPKTPKKEIQRELKYPCPHTPECSLQFPSKLALDSHLKADHGLVKVIRSRKKYPPECYDESDTRKRRFRVKIPSKCEPCNKWFKSQDCLRTHMKFSHENKFPYYCKICGIGKNAKSTLEKHEAICSTEVKVTCPEEGCTFVVSRAKGLEIHFRDKHPEREPFSGCPHCDQKLYTKLGLARHLKSQHQISKAFQCEHCGQEFKQLCGVEKHKKISLRCKLLYKSETEATIICDICGGKYSSQANLEKHIKQQHEDKFEFRCDHCGKGYTKKNYLDVHLFKKHQIGDVSNLKFKCTVEGCSRIFFQSEPLRCHMAMHEGKTPGLTCEECGKQFYGRDGLRQHKRLMHANKEDKLKCEVCGAEFGVVDYLIRHKRTVHKIFPEKRRQDL